MSASLPLRKARLFLALWPRPAVRAAMAQYCATWQWPKKAALVRVEKLHLTLHFIGDVERGRLPELREQLKASFEAFDLQFGIPEVWPHGLAVLRPHAAPAALLRLQAVLGERLKGLALPVDGREFQPHVTLARRAGEAVPPAQSAAIEWHVDRYALVESGFDAKRTYTVLADYAT